MTDISELAQQDLAQLRDELSNQAIGSKDHLRKIALSLLDKLEKCRDREIRWLALSDEKSKIITNQEEALDKAQQRIAELESRPVTVKLPYVAEPIDFAPWAAKAFYQFHKDTVDSCVKAFSEACNESNIKLEIIYK